MEKQPGPCQALLNLRIKQRPTDHIRVKSGDVVHHEACTCLCRAPTCIGFNRLQRTRTLSVRRVVVMTLQILSALQPNLSGSAAAEMRI